MLLKSQTVSCLLNCFFRLELFEVEGSCFALICLGTCHIVVLAFDFFFFKASKASGVFCFVFFFFVLNCTSVIGNSVQQRSVKWTFLSHYLKEVISWVCSVVYTLPPGSTFNFGYSIWFKNIHLLLICLHSIQIPCTTEYMTYVYRTIVCILITSRLVSAVCSYSSLLFVLDLRLCVLLLVLLASGKLAGLWGYGFIGR